MNKVHQKHILSLHKYAIVEMHHPAYREVVANDEVPRAVGVAVAHSLPADLRMDGLQHLKRSQEHSRIYL